MLKGYRFIKEYVDSRKDLVLVSSFYEINFDSNRYCILGGEKNTFFCNFHYQKILLVASSRPIDSYRDYHDFSKAIFFDLKDKFTRYLPRNNFFIDHPPCVVGPWCDVSIVLAEARTADVVNIKSIDDLAKCDEIFGEKIDIKQQTVLGFNQVNNNRDYKKFPVKRAFSSGILILPDRNYPIEGNESEINSTYVIVKKLKKVNPWFKAPFIDWLKGHVDKNWNSLYTEQQSLNT